MTEKPFSVDVCLTWSCPHPPPDSGLSWVTFEEADYRFSEHRSNWAQAQRICTWAEASLASVHSAAEDLFLRNTMRKVGVLANLAVSFFTGSQIS